MGAIWLVCETKYWMATIAIAATIAKTTLNQGPLTFRSRAAAAGLRGPTALALNRRSKRCVFQSPVNQRSIAPASSPKPQSLRQHEGRGACVSTKGAACGKPAPQVDRLLQKAYQTPTTVAAPGGELARAIEPSGHLPGREHYR